MTLFPQVRFPSLLLELPAVGWNSELPRIAMGQLLEPLMEKRQTVSCVQCLHGTEFAPVSVTVPGRLGMAVVYPSCKPCTWATSASQPQPWDSVCVQDTPFILLLSVLWHWGWKDMVERKWWKKDRRQHINPTYRLLVEGTKMRVEMLAEAGQNASGEMKTVSMGCKENEKTPGTIRHSTRKNMSVWGREADVVRDHNKKETKLEVRTKYNKKGYQNKTYLCM